MLITSLFPENVSQKAERISSKQNDKSPKITAQLSEARPRRQHNPSKQYVAQFDEILEAGRFSKTVSNGW